MSTGHQGQGRDFTLWRLSRQVSAKTDLHPKEAAVLKCPANTGPLKSRSGESNTGVLKHSTGPDRSLAAGGRCYQHLRLETHRWGPTSLFNKELPKESDTH